MVFCTYCGNKLEENWIVCPNCGTSPKKIIEPEQMIITPQQRTVIPYQISNKEEKGKKRKIGKIVMIILIICLTGGLTLSLLTSASLQSNNLSLKNKYDNLISVLEDPLTDPDTPTLDELFNWLVIDDTNENEYTEYFTCGDFATMLMIRAKEMNWRMRIAYMFWSYEGDSGWQNPSDPYGSYGHAFNVILCQDYNGDSVDDWFYIEPQTDAIWYVMIGGVSFIHYKIWYTFTGGISGTVWSESYFINHYGYFA